MKHCTSFLILISCFVTANAQVNFPSGTYFPVGTQPLSICSADFNNDGNMDFATANSAVNTISIRFGNGAGGFASAISIPASVFVNALTSADFNNDGNADLAYINPNLYSVSIKLGNGLGGFGAANVTGTAVGPNALVSADFNGDGNMDLASSNSNTISVLMGNGSGGLSPAINYTAGNQVNAIMTADFNGDTKKDIAAANLNSSNISVFINTGTGSFNPAVNHLVPSGPDALCGADFNGDGKIDIATSNYDYSNVSILLGNGLGGFSSPTVIGTGSYPLSITCADFNGDGKIDVATANPYADSISVLVGNGTGGFAAAQHFFIAGGPYSIISVDFNNDGLKDIATANYLSNDVCVLLNNTGFSITASAGINGGITPSGTTTVPIGGSISYSITAANCYHISNVLIDGSSIGPVATYTFTAVTAAHTISAVFAPDLLVGSSVETACTVYTWTQNNNTTYTTTGIYTQTFLNAGGCDSIHTLHLTIGCNSMLTLTLFLQGYYTSNGIMAPALFNAGESANNLLTDSVKISLHNSNAPYTKLTSLMSVVLTDGSVNANFGSLSGTYYVAVTHRSSLETWSATPITISGGAPIHYNFSLAANKAYGDNMYEVEPGIWAFYTGDLNGDENIDLLDVPIMEYDILTYASGYFASDLNGDGNVDLLDSLLLEDNISRYVFVMHP